ncbi:permease [Marinospirillum insulare]|uniref:Permease n=2 Tax=Marinospirillum insulare TaxID=217169 RepID=A0ABQ5ZXI7_9GAMM|nr:permease [Marinospirillum insulare]
MGDLKLTAQQTWRSVKAGEYRVLLAALILAVACATLLGVVGERIQGALTQETARISGGDLVISGRKPASSELKQRFTQAELSWSEKVQLTSMASFADEFLLVSLHAVDEYYPLLGEVRLQGLDKQVWSQAKPPALDEIWMEPGLALRLGVTIGDELNVGGVNFKLTALLLETPDQTGGFSSFSPKALVSLASLEGSPLLGPLSRASWRLGVTGDASQLKQLALTLPEELEGHQRLRDFEESQPGIAKAMNEGQRYLAMAGLVAVLLAALAVALATQRQTKRQAKEVALLRCLGQTRARVRKLMLLQLFWLGLAAGLIGGVLGYLGHWGLIELLSPVLPLALPAASLKPMLAAFLLALWLLLGFSLAPLLSLGQVSPLAVLQARPWKLTTSAWLAYGLAAIATLGLGWWLSGDWLLTLWTLLGLGSIGLLVAGIGWLILRLVRNKLERFPWYWRQGLRRLGRNSTETLLQLSTFTLAFTAVLLVARGGDQLMNDWQNQLPDERPNQFAIDIQPYEKQAFEAVLDEQGLDHSQLYPLLRARLTQINEQQATDYVPAEAKSDNALSRELNLTWSAELPEGNKLESGVWWSDLPPAENALLPVSVESSVAKRLGLKLGDQLTFNLAGSPLQTRIVSLREVRWESFNPNFYVIFPPKVLEDKAHTFLASFVLPKDEASFMRNLTQQFPSVAFLDVRALLAQAEGILRQLSLGVQYLLGFVLLAGLLVTWALMMASLDARKREQVLLKVLGASRRSLAKRQALEFMLLGGLAGVLAAVLGELLYSLVAGKLLNLPWSPAPLFWLLPPAFGALLLAGFAHLALRESLETPPHQLLKELS